MKIVDMMVDGGTAPLAIRTSPSKFTFLTGMNVFPRSLIVEVVKSVSTYWTSPDFVHAQTIRMWLLQLSEKALPCHVGIWIFFKSDGR